MRRLGKRSQRHPRKKERERELRCLFFVSSLQMSLCIGIGVCPFLFIVCVSPVFFSLFYTEKAFGETRSRTSRQSDRVCAALAQWRSARSHCAKEHQKGTHLPKYAEEEIEREARETATQREERRPKNRIDSVVLHLKIDSIRVFSSFAYIVFFFFLFCVRY